ncbi:hypothetical protein L13192_08047 [Pyrenophora tritici-repentis]|uniref:Uncharacterized protein n=2 Tax=Pyrenophora tritici-repentis TaxID=45151 RepID=A0A922STI1_9PLEO|nr:uncharacterized protein PTRG_07467 [Pyrenophora tritici-repentis Pt-1C-BFP]EDU50386.1 predicted protein [Pyrenophora tritici-repentis Pt-1C-BFP]KAI1511439.1 hypothetical protein Ptr86124_009843 [Pyrenophora tritici-repentis]KAI1667338.1 hypothetical protein L13192_08047 [Pyrenophora tritici-repentis]KAI1679534.1 hypothetical protein KJE20_10174 [Pyrenophora tritici-repentis]
MPNTPLLLLSFLSIAIYLLTPRPRPRPRPYPPPLKQTESLQDSVFDMLLARDLPHKTSGAESVHSNNEDVDQAQDQGQRIDVPRRTSIRWTDDSNSELGETMHVRVNGDDDIRDLLYDSLSGVRSSGLNGNGSARTASPPPPRTLHSPFIYSPSPSSSPSPGQIHNARIFFSPQTLPPLTPLLLTLQHTTPPLDPCAIRSILRQHIIDSGLAFADAAFSVPINRDGRVSVQRGEGDRGGQALIGESAGWWDEVREWECDVLRGDSGEEERGEVGVWSLAGAGDGDGDGDGAGTTIPHDGNATTVVHAAGEIQSNGVVGGPATIPVETARLRRRSAIQDLGREFWMQDEYQHAHVNGVNGIDGGETGTHRDTDTGVDTEVGAEVEVEVEDGWWRIRQGDGSSSSSIA